MTRRIVVIGGGIVGLAVADRLLRDHRDVRVSLLEKEATLAAHQSGHNSGVIHTGIYYPPGSRKADLCRRGAASMLALARAEDVPFAVRGKLIVATSEAELAALAVLADRGRANGVAVRELDADGAREIEPAVRCLRALHVPETGVIDYVEVCAALARRIRSAGGDIRLRCEVRGIGRVAGAVTVRTGQGEFAADVVINCAGLYSDRVARLAGVRGGVRIVPFRGEYFQLRESARPLVRSLIYPVPDPAYPFLGVHLSRGVDGAVHVGPNAVLALAREGYDWRTVRLGELAATVASPGFAKFAAAHAGTGIEEVRRSLSHRRFARSVRRLVPAVADADLVRSGAGVRAQAMTAGGQLVDDFVIERQAGIVHVLNAPSPAATSSLEIAGVISDLIRQ